MACADRKGGSVVEAAVVMPIVILTVSGLISVGMELYVKVRDVSIEDRADAVRYVESRGLRAEDYLRMRRAAR